MRVFKKSDAILIVGLVYSIIVAAIACAGAVYFFYHMIHATSGDNNLFLGLVVLFGWFYCLLGGVLCLAIGTMSILSSINAIKAMDKHQRRNYRCCKIFGMISINPFYAIGANMGLSIWHKIDAARVFLRS